MISIKIMSGRKDLEIMKSLLERKNFEITASETKVIEEVLRRHKFDHCNLEWITSLANDVNEAMKDKTEQIFSNLQTTLRDRMDLERQAQKDNRFIQELQDENVKLREENAELNKPPETMRPLRKIFEDYDKKKESKIDNEEICDCDPYRYDKSTIDKFVKAGEEAAKRLNPPKPTKHSFPTLNGYNIEEPENIWDDDESF